MTGRGALRGGTLRAATTVLAAACVLVSSLSGQATAAGAGENDGEGGTTGGSPRPYRTAEDAKAVTGSAHSIDGPTLRSGRYTDTLEPAENSYYSVDLDDSSHVYVSAVLVPPPGTEVDYNEGFHLSIEGTDGTVCDETEVTFEAGHLSRPLAGHAVRYVEPEGDCQQQGTYSVRLERVGTSSSQAAWPVELQVMREPGVREEPPPPPADLSRATEPPPQPTAPEPKEVSGGSSFNDPPAVADGVWKDRVLPGETRFYKVPLGWSQQLFAQAEFSNAAAEGEYVPDALRMEVYNPARGLAAEESESYQGKPQDVEVATAPVHYGNRHESDDEVAHTSVSGWYYLAVTVHRRVASVAPDGLPFLLRLALKGEPGTGPRYDGDATDAGFGITEDDREQAAKGLTDEQVTTGDTMRLVGYLGLGVGTTLLLVLGGWTLLARRRAAAVGSPPPADPVPPGHTPPYPGP